MSDLQLRLKNCLQTILDLEPGMHENGEDSFDREFSSIKFFLSHVDQMELMEEEVRWMEDVTVIVLSELSHINPVKLSHGLLQ